MRGTNEEFAGISIHAPHEGCDLADGKCTLQSIISIHAPHEGCDRAATYFLALPLYFNPRTP